MGLIPALGPPTFEFEKGLKRFRLSFPGLVLGVFVGEEGVTKGSLFSSTTLSFGESTGDSGDEAGGFQTFVGFLGESNDLGTGMFLFRSPTRTGFDWIRLKEALRCVLPS